MGPIFLTLDEVLALHDHQIRRYGGAAGVRDVGLLASAIGMPSATFDGVLLHAGLAEMAAAYLFHLVQNHPFVDGNKRIGLAAALVFLRMNSVRIQASEDELVDLVLGVAGGRIGKAEVAVFLQRHQARSTGAR
ncbi:MAG: type II toxin-antitoxin system death-on-curing family toxin [Deltaproteobacteria bacterium]|nr:type II toxin-antitoxin system death-on-curing family toxin [Deltaproteobacteria bacterium]